MVMSELVPPLRVPPSSGISLRLEPTGTFSESLNDMCSKKCANPVLPGRSRLEPTCMMVATATIGSEWFSCSTTSSPLSSV